MLTQPFSEEERKLLNKTCEEQLKAHGRIVWAQVSVGTGQCRRRNLQAVDSRPSHASSLASCTRHAHCV